MIYIYDGSFEGFLTAVCAAYRGGTSHLEGIRPEGGAASLFSEEIKVETRLSDAERVAGAFYDACGRAASRWLYRAFLAEMPGREDVLFEYMRRGFRMKKEMYAHRTEHWMMTVLEWSETAGNEAGKLLGLVRFSELREGMLYAELRPTHDVLPLIAGHFRRRLGGTPWAIADIVRRRVIYYDGHALLSGMLAAHEGEPAVSDTEEDFRRLWQEYYKHMGIAERRDPALRRSFMPEKYWGELTEMARPENRI